MMYRPSQTTHLKSVLGADRARTRRPARLGLERGILTGTLSRLTDHPYPRSLRIELADFPYHIVSIVTKRLFTLGTFLRYGVLTRQRKINTISPRIFQGPQRRQPDTARDACFYENQRPPIFRTSRFQGQRNLTKKRYSSPGPPSTSPPSSVRYRLGPKDLSPCPVGNLNPIPFPVGRGDNTSMCLAFRQRLASERNFSDPLGPTDPCSTAVPWNPSPLQSPQLSLEYLLLPPRSAPVAAPGGSRPGILQSTHGHRDPPTHCMRRNLHDGSSAVAARYRAHAGASSIFRSKFCFVGELLQHSLANFRLPWHRPLSRATTTFHGVS
ncbi:hypothetical protein JTE90_024063 [Oedothorax gibbosus]|uniref:Uncharacterized protein n=1 Tax=Oedothorax gibbosus TaxID=931172 RepID=A0AAV6TD90_9ARAC|nr:hypothetical protein JTE90_024063 [Oedothorax gibbosus]